MFLSMKVHVHWINLMKNQIIQKFQSLEILKKKATRQKNSFKKPFDKKYIFNEFKMFSFKCRSFKIAKKMFGCPLKLILGFFEFFCISCYEQNYSYTIMYECENSPLHMNYLKLDYLIFLT